MSDGTPTSYAELIVLLDALPILVREKRRREGISLREAGRQAGVGLTSVMRVERGEDANLRATVMPLLKWVAR